MKRYKYNIKLIISLLIIIILITTGLILFFKTDFFRTKRSAFLRYFQEIPRAINILENTTLDEYSAKKKDTPYTIKSEMKIQTSSNIADSTILDKLRFIMDKKVDYQNEKSKSEIVIKNNNEELEKISLVRNRDLYGIYCADVANGYITVKNSELKRIAEDAEIENIEYIPNKIYSMNLKKILETTKSEKKHINECLNLIKNNVPTTAYNKESKKKIKINNDSYSTVAYTLTLDSNSNANLQIDLLNKISQDSILMDYLASKFKLLNFNEEYTTINSLNNIMKKRIEKLKANPSEAKKLIITLYEYKQRNIRTEIKNGDNTIILDHLIENNKEQVNLKINNKSFGIQNDGEKYIINYSDDSENSKSIKIEYNQTGSIENNDIRNNMTICYTSGIKSITYEYTDQVNFTNNIGTIPDFEDYRVAILNEYNDEQIKEFIKNLKNKINDVYVKKGASIGINLDPLFSH